jgi:hypothetical protein
MDYVGKGEIVWPLDVPTTEGGFLHTETDGDFTYTPSHSETLDALNPGTQQ